MFIKWSRFLLQSSQCFYHAAKANIPLQHVISYLSASGIKTMLLNALFQNTVDQFLKIHVVNLADNDQLCKGILRNGYRIVLLIRTCT